jgi:hypothetical protein
VFQVYGTASLGSFWYWVLCILVWTLVCNRTLGVPHAMLRRAGRVPEVAERVDLLALITAERIGEVYDDAGMIVAGLTGFALAVLGFTAFVTRVELAQAVFLLGFPLTIVAYSTLRLALAIRARRLSGPRLRRLLAVRRFWHTVVAVAALMITASLAVIEHPGLILN